MDMNQIQAALAEIRDLAEVKHDAEGCESRQKDLWDAFIRHIATIKRR